MAWSQTWSPMEHETCYLLNKISGFSCYKCSFIWLFSVLVAKKCNFVKKFKVLWQSSRSLLISTNVQISHFVSVVLNYTSKAWSDAIQPACLPILSGKVLSHLMYGYTHLTVELQCSVPVLAINFIVWWQMMSQKDMIAQINVSFTWVKFHLKCKYGNENCLPSECTIWGWSEENFSVFGTCCYKWIIFGMCLSRLMQCAQK